jgi:hypothetical protein
MIEQLKELIYLRGSIRFGPSHDINTAYAEVHFSGLYNLGGFPYTGICTIQRKIVLLGKKNDPIGPHHRWFNSGFIWEIIPMAGPV